MKALLIFTLWFTAIIATKSTLAFQDTENSLFKIAVWRAGEGNMDGYRIPGMVVATDGTVLAYAEARPTWGDSDPKSIVLKRSKDGGITWSENIYIEKCDGSYWKKHAGLIDPHDVRDKKEVWTNPAAIVDRTTGRIFLFYALSEGAIAGQNLQRYTSVFYKYSDDQGLSWSERVDITGVLNSGATDENGFSCDALGRAFHMPGPGHGLQLSDGRLLLQVWKRAAIGVLGKGSTPVDERKYGLCTIYSDDHGATWKYGSAFGHNVNMNEARMAELDNGDIYLNARYVNSDPEKKNNHRVTALSHDKGINWEDISVDSSFPLSNPCDAGLISLKNDKDGSVIMYSKNESVKGRRNLFLRLSDDGGKSWPLKKLMHKGPASYSDLTVLPDDSVLLLFETGKGRPVYCIKFDLDWFKNENE